MSAYFPLPLWSTIIRRKYRIIKKIIGVENCELPLEITTVPREFLDRNMTSSARSYYSLESTRGFLRTQDRHMDCLDTETGDKGICDFLNLFYWGFQRNSNLQDIMITKFMFLSRTRESKLKVVSQKQSPSQSKWFPKISTCENR